MLYRASWFVVLVTTLALSLVAAAQDPQGNPGRITGRVADSAGTPVRGATVILSKAGGETIAISVTTPNGDYAMPALPPAGYVIQAFAVGFGPSRLMTVNVESGKDLKQDIAMDIGFARTTQLSGLRTGTPAGQVVNVGRGSSAPTVLNSGNPARLRVGGNVASGNLLQQTQPEYPPLAKQARIQGVVILEAVIAADGSVKELKVISGHPLLQQAAINAVSAWRYKPFLLNGQPTEIETTVTVTFALPN